MKAGITEGKRTLKGIHIVLRMTVKRCNLCIYDILVSNSRFGCLLHLANNL